MTAESSATVTDTEPVLPWTLKTLADNDPDPETERPLPTDTAPTAVAVAYGSTEDASNPDEIGEDDL